MQPRSDDTTRPKLPDAKPQRLWLQWSTRNPVLRVAATAACVVSLVLLLAPASLELRIPADGAVAERDLRASHDFVYKRENPNLARQQAEAESEVLAVYRYSSDFGERRGREISASFRDARRVLQEHEDKLRNIDEKREAELLRIAADEEMVRLALDEARKREAEAAATPPDAGEPAPPPLGPSSLELEQSLQALAQRALDVRSDSDAEAAQERKSLVNRLANAELDFRTTLGLDGDLRFDAAAFQSLVDDSFSVSSEDVVQESVETVMTRRIVRDLERLEERLHSGVRVLGDERPAGVRDLDQYLDLASARERAAAEVRQRLEQTGRPLNPHLRAVLTQLAASLVQENFVFDAGTTAAEKARARSLVAAEIAEPYLKGQTILEAGQRVTARHLEVLAAMQASAPRTPPGMAQLGVAAIVVVLFGFLAWALRSVRARMRVRARDVVLFGIVVVGEVALLRLSMAVSEGVLTVWPAVPPMALYFAMPVAMGSMLLRLFTRVEAAAVFALVASVLVGILAQNAGQAEYVWPLSLVMVLYSIVSNAAGMLVTSEIRQRTTLLVSGLKVGLVNAAVAAAIHIGGGGAVDWTLSAMAAGGVLGGIFAYFAIIALTPVLETTLGYATDMKLLELANMNQPALKELSMRAPGTYHHSIMVGNLAEAAAEVIGANPLMTRVGAYYHDLGKMRNPRYFAENQAGDNPHDKIKPHMSALIIKSHVKDGIEIARRYRLPQDIIDFVPEHHGSALIGYFYARAKEQAGSDNDRDVDEVDFRYPGPKPQRKETALVMLADGVEASARSLSDPNPMRLKALVKKIVNGKFIDGQLDECELTFKDLNAIVDSFNRVLISIYHGRPEYPPIPGERERARERLGIDLNDMASAPDPLPSTERPLAAVPPAPKS